MLCGGGVPSVNEPASASETIWQALRCPNGYVAPQFVDHGSASFMDGDRVHPCVVRVERLRICEYQPTAPTAWCFFNSFTVDGRT